MDTSNLFLKIESLPIAIQQQVADFVDFLQERHIGRPAEKDSLLEDEKKELQMRLDAYIENPSTGIGLEEMEKMFEQKHGA